eukprot:11209746-Lingulodinium_polyedra.AAC.1
MAAWMLPANLHDGASCGLSVRNDVDVDVDARRRGRYTRERRRWRRARIYTTSLIDRRAAAPRA